MERELSSADQEAYAIGSAISEYIFYFSIFYSLYIIWAYFKKEVYVFGPGGYTIKHQDKPLGYWATLIFHMFLCFICWIKYLADTAA